MRNDYEDLLEASRKNEHVTVADFARRHAQTYPSTSFSAVLLRACARSITQLLDDRKARDQMDLDRGRD